MNSRLALALTLVLVLLPAVPAPNLANLSPPVDAGPASADWQSAMRANIRDAEYHVTWADRTYLEDLPAGYQAPNRAQNLRVYFTSAGVTVIPRTWPGDAERPPWQCELRLASPSPQPPLLQEPQIDRERVEYARGPLRETWRNTEAGLAYELALPGPPASARVEWEVGGDLAPRLTPDGVELVTADGAPVLRLFDLTATDGRGRAVAVEPGLSGDRLSLRVDGAPAGGPIQIGLVLAGLPTSSNWSYDSDRANTGLGDAVATAGDVNGDGYSDVLVGAQNYDGGQTNEGKFYIFHGSGAGLHTTEDWSRESGQAEAKYGAAVGTAGDVNGDGYADVIVGAPYWDDAADNEGGVWVYFGSDHGLFGTMPEYFRGNQANAHLGASAGFAGDVNDDGYADVIAGAPGYDNGAGDEGVAWVWYGSAAGLSDSANWQAESNQGGANFGCSVGTAGDVNRDGFADVIVGAVLYEHNQTRGGRAFAWHGSASGLNGGVGGDPTNADFAAGLDQAWAYFGTAVGTAGDVNGDGYSDVIVGSPDYTSWAAGQGAAWVYKGSAAGLISDAHRFLTVDGAHTKFGGAVGTAGDVNGDGLADVVVGANLWSNGSDGEGGAWVYYGGEVGLDGDYDWHVEGNRDNARYGVSVGTAGDVNGDGFSDLIVGASGYSDPEAGEGKAFVYHGSATGIGNWHDWSKRSAQSGSDFGYSVATAGDVNGDGYSDIVVGAPYWDGGGADGGGVWVYRGASGGIVDAPYWHKSSSQASAHFGYSVGCAGDVNGDGYDDVIVGGPDWDDGETNEGAAWVYRGASTGVVDAPLWYRPSNQANARFGFSVGGAGDVNGDGYGDVIVGAPYYDEDHDNEGWAGVYYGSAEGLPAASNWHKVSRQDGAHFGWSVATAGDVNLDGFSDVIIGAPDWDDGQTDEGAAWIYRGASTGVVSTPLWYRPSNKTGSRFGYAVSTAGDVNGDSHSDVIIGAPMWTDGQDDEGGAFVYRGTMTGPTSPPIWSKQSDQAWAYFGQAVGCAGDVNGDGYADVVVGAPGWDGAGVALSIGQAFVYHGRAGGLNTTPAAHPNGITSGALLGTSVAGAGDVNGDGYGDVIAGAPDETEATANEGVARVYYGNGGDGLILKPVQRRTGGGFPIAHLGMSDGFSGFVLGATVRNPFGTGRVRLEAEIKVLNSPFNGSGLEFLSDWSNRIPGEQILGEVEDVSGAQHWRLRWVYKPSGTPWLPASRWFTIPLNGWNEMDLRTFQIWLRLFVPFVSQGEGQ